MSGSTGGVDREKEWKNKATLPCTETLHLSNKKKKLSCVHPVLARDKYLYLLGFRSLKKKFDCYSLARVPLGCLSVVGE